MRHMTARELQAYLAQAPEKPFLLDVREPWEFQHCHIEGSELIPMGHIPTAHQELDFDRKTVVICHHGIRSRHVAQYLENMGFTNLINLSGGVDAWAREVDPHMPTY
jgi:rhodanese-related sulfurtransferase